MAIDVVMVTPTQGVIGGIENFFLEVAEFLKSEPDFNLTLIVKVVNGYQMGGGLQTRLEDIGLPFTIYQGAERLPLRHLFGSKIVYCQNPIPEVCFFARLTGKILVVTHHNWLRPQFTLSRLRWIIGSKLAHVRWYNSKFVRATWEKTAPSPRSEAFATVSNLPMAVSSRQDRSGFVFISRWINNKGVEQLIQAYESARIDKSVWPLTMAGTGPLREHLSEKGLLKDIVGLHVPGFISESEKTKLIGRSKWLIAPPVFAEDMGLTPLEARSQGVPCIVSRIGGLVEVAGPGSILVEPGDVASLRRALEAAASFGEEEYREISENTFSQLKMQLRLKSFYVSTFRKLASQ